MLGSVAVVALVMNWRFCLGLWILFLLYFFISQLGNRFGFNVICFPVNWKAYFNLVNLLCWVHLSKDCCFAINMRFNFRVFSCCFPQLFEELNWELIQAYYYLPNLLL